MSVKSGKSNLRDGRFTTGLRFTVTGLACFGGACLVAMMAVTVVDVVMRYVFNAPIRGALDLAKMLLLLTVFSAVPYCAYLRGHVAIDLFVDRLGARPKRIIAVLVAVPSVLILAALSWQSINAAALASLLGSATNILVLPFAPLHWLIALSAFLWAIVIANQVYCDLNRAGRDE